MGKKVLPIQKNDIYKVLITGLNHEGDGVAKVKDFTVFVKRALPGEELKIRITKTKSSFAYAKIEEILKPSPSRVEPNCPVYKRCGGCHLQHMDYQAQLKFKWQIVADSLKRIGKFENINILPTIGSNEEWYYRNKAQFPIGESEGGLISGFYASRTHQIVEVDRCIIQHADSNEMVETAKKILSDSGVSAYCEETGKGFIRHIITKNAFATGQKMLILVTNGRKFPNKDKVVKKLMEKIPDITSLIQNVNSEKTNVILGKESIVLAGSPAIVDIIGGLKFKISSLSFYQVNPLQTEILYRKALEYALLDQSKTVIDAYCGIGTITLFLAQKAGKVYGVEVVENAIEDAKENARINGIENAEFIVGRAEEVIPQLYRQGVRADVIVVDPPRKGCDEALLEIITRMGPERVVYVSCNPSTLARDLRCLADGGYEIIEVQPVDMFPQTHHIECVVLLKRKHSE